MAGFEDTVRALLENLRAHQGGGVQAWQQPQEIRQAPDPGSFETGHGNWQDPNFQGAQAVSRFTHDPVLIAPASRDPDGEDPVDQVSGFTQQMNLPGKAPYSHIEAYTQPTAGYADLQHVLAHEQIHALLNRLPDRGKDLPWETPATGKEKSEKFPYTSAPTPQDKATQAFYHANRMGNASMEVPAYLGAFKQGQLPGVSADDANRWNQEFLKGLPAPIAAILQRIIASQASQAGTR